MWQPIPLRSAHQTVKRRIGAATPCVYYVCSPRLLCGLCGSRESIFRGISRISNDFEFGGSPNPSPSAIAVKQLMLNELPSVAQVNEMSPLPAPKMGFSHRDSRGEHHASVNGHPMASGSTRRLPPCPRSPRRPCRDATDADKRPPPCSPRALAGCSVAMPSSVGSPRTWPRPFAFVRLCGNRRSPYMCSDTPLMSDERRS
jgi:hypothetical protein